MIVIITTTIVMIVVKNDLINSIPIIKTGITRKVLQNNTHKQVQSKTTMISVASSYLLCIMWQTELLNNVGKKCTALNRCFCLYSVPTNK